jgi:hypothetical protein
VYASVIEYQREADQVIECAGEMVNRIEKLLSSGQKDAATREELKILIRQAQKAFKEARRQMKRWNSASSTQPGTLCNLLLSVKFYLSCLRKFMCHLNSLACFDVLIVC